MQRHQIGLDRPIVAAATVSTQQVTPLTAAMRTLIVNSLLEAGNSADRIAADVSDLNSTLRAWHRRLQVAVNDAAEARKNSIDQLVIRTRAETSHERQRLWLAAILRRGTGGAVNAFLDLAGDPAIAPAAFEAAKEADSRTIDKLFEALQSRRVPTRQTAAQVLGALNRPQVSQRLAQMAMESSRSPRSADRAIEQFRSRRAQVCGRCATRFRNRPVASSAGTFLTLGFTFPLNSLSWSSDMKTTSRVFLCAFVLGLGFILFAEVANAQSSKAGANAGNAANAGEMVTRVYPVADLVFTAPELPVPRIYGAGDGWPIGTKRPRRRRRGGHGGWFRRRWWRWGLWRWGHWWWRLWRRGGRFQRGAGRKTAWQCGSRGRIFGGRQWCFHRLAGGCV